jgi:valyl-tRNA synthetase
MHGSMTTASVTNQLPKSYTPAEAEGVVRARWEDARVFHAEPATGVDAPTPYCILIPPPNVTAALHLGHAFNNTLQDVLIRHQRMRGSNTLWMPGTDHAGIATQTVVEKRLLTEHGKKRTDFERDAFVARVQEWKDEYEHTITEQLKSIGCSCDWARQRFTMDAVCATAVREAFFRLFGDGLIYRGKRLVNWDPVTQTALADDEVEMQEVQGHFWYLRYPLVHPSRNADDPFDTEPVTWSELASRGYPVPDDPNHGDDTPAWVTVATTRPETYLGDTAVAVNPRDPRATALVGLMAQLPLVGRVIPVIVDDYVVLPDPDSPDPKAQYATGFLKVTPGHDPNDWDIGQRHESEIAMNSSGQVVVNVLAPDASISDAHGWTDVGDGQLFVGLSREDARAKVVREFDGRGLLEATKPYTHSVGHSYRSHVPIEPYLSDQWYVKVTDDRLVGEAQRALCDEQFEGTKPSRTWAPESAGGTGVSPVRSGDGELTFYPARYAKMYQAWHENLRDWCISRQLWWGHRIPVWRRRTAATEPPAHLAEMVEALLGWQAAGRVALQYRGEAAPLASVEKQDLDLTAFFVCVRDPDGEDAEISRALERWGLEQDPDVLDTWFSSGLWPLNTMGWPQPEQFPETVGLLETFNPTSVLVTARDIITLWVSRMVMFNRYFNDGKVPFRHVYINPLIQDGHGQRMSKSLGNGVDPRDIIHGHGADALRFTLVQMATSTQDCRMPVDMVCPHCAHAFHPKEMKSPAGYRVASPQPACPSCGRSMVSAYGAASGEARPSEDAPLARNSSSKFDEGRNFCNKLWNATRFALSNLAGNGTPDIAAAPTTLVDRWIVTCLHRTLHQVEDALAAYQFSVYADAMYDFIWRQFCDWYLEAIKPTVKSDPVQQQVLRTVLSAALRMLHPICPFVTEVLWSPVQATGTAGLEGIVLPDAEILAVAAWPDIACRVDDADALAMFERMQGLVGSIRKVRADRNVPPRRAIRLLATPTIEQLAAAAPAVLETLAGLKSVDSIPADRPGDAIPLAFEGDELLLTDLVDQVDLEAEATRLERLIADKTRAVESLSGRLGNDRYVQKAPPHLVQETRDQLAQAEADLAAARNALESVRRPG